MKNGSLTKHPFQSGCLEFQGDPKFVLLPMSS